MHGKTLVKNLITNRVTNPRFCIFFCGVIVVSLSFERMIECFLNEFFEKRFFCSLLKVFYPRETFHEFLKMNDRGKVTSYLYLLKGKALKSILSLRLIGPVKKNLTDSNLNPPFSLKT